MVDGEADIVAGHAVAMERRRRRLAEAAGLDPGHKRQAEFIRGVESRWKPHVAKELCLGANLGAASVLFRL